MKKCYSFIRNKEDELLCGLLFWQEVEEWATQEGRNDRLLRLFHAWNLYNKYIAQSSYMYIGLEVNEIDKIYRNLQKSDYYVDSEIFDDAKEFCIEKLEKPWIRYLKEDTKHFIECCHIRITSPPSTAEEIEVFLDDHHQIVIRHQRPWIGRQPSSTETQRAERLRTALSLAESIDEARQAEIRRKAKERRAEMERERKKAIRAAKKRQREAKMRKGVSFQVSLHTKIYTKYKH